MTDHLCHCLEGKGKKIIKREEESVGLEYTLNNDHFSTPESKEVMVEDRNEFCRCGVKDDPIIISNDVPVENEIPVRIQVEYPPPANYVVPCLVSH